MHACSYAPKRPVQTTLCEIGAPPERRSRSGVPPPHSSGATVDRESRVAPCPAAAPWPASPLVSNGRRWGSTRRPALMSRGPTLPPSRLRCRRWRGYIRRWPGPTCGRSRSGRCRPCSGPARRHGADHQRVARRTLRGAGAAAQHGAAPVGHQRRAARRAIRRGRVSGGEVERGRLTPRWSEAGGPPVAGPPAYRGFGTRMVEAAGARPAWAD